MTTTEQKTRKPGTPGTFSRWFQRTMNARTSTNIRRGRAQLMGMDLLRQYPVIRLAARPVS